MSDKLNVDTTVLENLMSVSKERSVSNLGVYPFTIMGTSVVIDFSFISRARDYSIPLANGLVLIFLSWYNVKKVIWLIRGSAPVEGSSGGKDYSKK